MERVTRKDVEAAFRLLVNQLGGHVAQRYDDVDGFVLDYAGMYGGYLIEQVHQGTVGHGVTRPFGNYRRKAREMYLALHFGLDVLRFEQQQKEKEDGTMP